MAGRLASKAVVQTVDRGLLVTFAADQREALQVSLAENFSFGSKCVPFDGGSVLPDRKWLVLTFPTDNVFRGTSGVSVTTGYKTRGSNRAATFTGVPDTAAYSNRFQFLRGQYAFHEVLQGVQICAIEGGGPEKAGSLEVA
jgi:hypothetical protein